MNVCGIDYSTRAVDLVTIPYDHDGPPKWRRWELGKYAKAFDRTRSVGEWVPGRGASFWDDIVAVGIEHPGGKFGTGDMLRVQGAILSCIPARMLVEPWPPAKWRKAVGLPGNAAKETVAWESALQLGWIDPRLLGWTQDAHDAHLIALATRQAIQTQAAA